MVLVWGYLARGNDGLTLVMVAINSLTMLVLYGAAGRIPAGRGPAAGALAGAGAVHRHLRGPAAGGRLPVPAAGSSQAKGEQWFTEKFLHVLTPITIIALLATLVLLFSLQGRGDPRQPADDPLDRHPAVHPDHADLLAGLLVRRSC
ncbi:MAG: hypothetical protein M0C28_00275 [Candidatus Moduliflexus flocculans]|nr:hypothetical protein [Candidatus Moduliflexus flocculans]